MFILPKNELTSHNLLQFFSTEFQIFLCNDLKISKFCLDKSSYFIEAWYIYQIRGIEEIKNFMYLRGPKPTTAFFFLECHSLHDMEAICLIYYSR